MKILITGGTTFVSRYAAEHFVSKGEEVFCSKQKQQTSITRCASD